MDDLNRKVEALNRQLLDQAEVRSRPTKKIRTAVATSLRRGFFTSRNGPESFINGWTRAIGVFPRRHEIPDEPVWRTLERDAQRAFDRHQP